MKFWALLALAAFIAAILLKSPADLYCLCFLKSLDTESTLKNTVVFAKLQGDLEKTQALIPLAIIDTGEIWLAQCAEQETEANMQIGEIGIVD
ncbi:hypothetical protein BDW59DRAFT_168090 [Aspergillus cavernicola]|uniref:Uncharacterized protein n=1 Tax=Aspergillus cavernicola TaxID=176166 RepID=A0ABR4H5Z8_9EURO